MTVVYDLGNLAEWASGLGTIAATGIALYLALRDDSERLGITIHVNAGVFDFIVYNSGAKPLVLRNVGFEIGWFRPSPEGTLEMMTGVDDLPTTLAPGADYRKSRTLQYGPSYLPDRLFQIEQKRQPWDRALYFVAISGSDRRFRYRIPPGSREKLIQKGQN